VFELLPVLTPENRTTQILFFKIICDYALFAFSINLLREIAKDIEDIDGDYNQGMNTLPIAIGRTRSKNILAVLNFVPLGSIIYYCNAYTCKRPVALGCLLLSIEGALIYLIIKTFNANTKTNFSHLSTMYKWVMFVGVLSLLPYLYIL